MAKNKSNLFKGNSLFISLLVGSLLLLVLFISVATLSGAWPETDISAQILSALAGAVVTAIITMFLLLGQTSNEEKKERNAKIFEEKLRIYNEFLQNLCQVVRDMEISKEEEIMLEFQVAHIAMHTTSESILNISDQVKDIILSIKNSEYKSNEMLSQLFVIADTFYKELYGKENDYNEQERNKTLLNFSSILVEKENIKNYEDEQRKAIIDSFANKSKLNLTDRTQLLKALIDKNDSSQWIWKRTTLVHEYYTDVDKNTNKYKDTNNKIAIDMQPLNGNSYEITIFTRKYSEQSARQLAEALFGTFTPRNDNDKTRHLYKILPFSMSNEAIAQEMMQLLQMVKNYRNKTYPLN